MCSIYYIIANDLEYISPIIYSIQYIRLIHRYRLRYSMTMSDTDRRTDRRTDGQAADSADVRGGHVTWWSRGL